MEYLARCIRGSQLVYHRLERGNISPADKAPAHISLRIDQDVRRQFCAVETPADLAVGIQQHGIVHAIVFHNLHHLCANLGEIDLAIPFALAVARLTFRVRARKMAVLVQFGLPSKEMPRMINRSAFFLCSSIRSGISIKQPGHQVVQKFNNIILPLKSESRTVLPFRSCSRKSAVGRSSGGLGGTDATRLFAG